MKGGSLFFDDLLDAQLHTFNPRYAEAEGALLGQLRHLHTDIDDNRDFLFSPIVLQSLHAQDHHSS
jgi:type I restriction enzyme R subunit